MSLADPIDPITGLALFVGFIAVFALSLWAWFRMMTAKTTQDYLKWMAVFAGPLLLLFAILYSLGFFPEIPRTEPPRSKDLPSPIDLFANMPPLQMLFVGLTAITWLIGGNVLMYSTAKRQGLRWYQMLNPLRPPFQHFEGRDWATLGALLILSLLFASIALSYTPSGAGAYMKLKQTREPVTSFACANAAPEPLRSLTWC